MIQEGCEYLDNCRRVRTFTLGAIPGHPILSFVAQQVATIAEETPSGHWSCSTVPAARGDGGGLSTCNDSLLAVRACGIPTLGNNGKIYRSLRWQQELPQQKLMRVRFECFGLSVLLETNSSFLSPDRKRKRQTQIELRDASLEQPSPESCSQPAYGVTRPAGMARTGYLWKCAANVAAGPRAEVQMASRRPNRRFARARPE